jgi:hypothetical protein
MNSKGDFTMGPDDRPPARAAAPAGLPPVAPPSGKLLFQMFIVPAIMVAAVVLIVFVGFQIMNWAFGVYYSPESFLKKLDDGNAEVRWRAAADLSQVLPRDRRLADDPIFALELAKRLETAHEASRVEEDAFAEIAAKLSPEDAEAPREKLRPNRNYVYYLTASLGEFTAPVGAPLLCELAMQETGLEPRAQAAQRRRAVWALANLGEHLKRFDALPAPQQDAIIGALDAASKGDDSRAAGRAGDAGRLLTKRRGGVPDSLGVDKALEHCAKADDPFLRELAALAMSFWRGDEAAEKRIEDALVQLTVDDGRGEDDEHRKELSDDPPGEANARAKTESQARTKTPGLVVRYNATVALARRGSPKVNLGVLKDMLDESFLREQMVLTSPNGGPERPDDGAVAQTVFNALKAVAELHRLRPDKDLSEVREAVNKLASSANPALKAEAEKTRLALGSPD